MNILHRAGALYDRALDAGKPFTLGDLTEALTVELLDDEHDLSELVALAADQAFRRVDKDRTAAAPQSSLFDMLDQAVPIDAGRRLSRRAMRLPDWIAHLGHVADNAARVNGSAARENRRFTALAPFLVGETTTEAAMKAWQEAHPGEVLA